MSNRIGTVIFLAGTILLNILAVDAFAFQCADVTEIPTAECEALQDLYSSTNGANWNDKTGWLANNTPCGWFGVTCRDGQVVYLNLSNNGLQGNIPETIGSFSTLEYLNLNGNELAGGIPASIGQLTVLNQLRLADNQLTIIPESIGQCSALTFLDLGNNQINDIPPQIGLLSNLNYLKLSSNQLTSTSFPAEFSNLAALETLDIFENALTSLPASVSDLTNLKGINLGWNKPLESLAGIGKLTGLENLYIHSTELTALPEEIASLTNLKVLWLTGNLFTQFPSVVTQLTGLETLLLKYNPQMSGELPLSLVNLTQMKEFTFDLTELCVPQNAGFQVWLAGVATVASSGKECVAPSNMSDIEKSVRVMRMLTGHVESCADLDVDGNGKVKSIDAVLALKKAANVTDTTCGDNWTVVGDIPEYSFSSEPLLDENTAFTMNVDPSDQLMLTSVTTNGWTIEYFAVKDTMGAPVFLTETNMLETATGKYLRIKFDDEKRPISVEQQDGKTAVLNWSNCTIYGEKEWAVIGTLPDFSSMPPLVVNDETVLLQNTDAYDSLCFTATTSNGWAVEYFGTKDTEGYMTGMTFINAVNSSTGDSFRAKIDEYGQPSQISNQDGTISNIDPQRREIHQQSGILPLPSRAINPVQSKLKSMCGKMAGAVSNICPAYGLLPVGPNVFSFGCSVGSLIFQETVCNESPNYPKIVCSVALNGISTAIGMFGGALFVVNPVAGVIAAAVSVGIGKLADPACDQLYGSSSGDPHLRTFDGLGYDFQAVGEFVYIQSTEAPKEMTVQIRQESSGDSKHVAWNTAIAMSVGGDIVEINGKNNPPVSINRTPTPMANNEIIQLKNGCKIYAESQSRYFVIWKDNSIVNVRLHGVYFAITTSLPDSRKGLVKGLLGDSDGDKKNDLQSRDGSKTFDIATKLTKGQLYNEFGNSWRITQDESLFTYADGEDTATYTDLNFPYELVTTSDLSETVRANAEQVCRDAGITNPILLEDCILDVGMTGDATFADNMKDLTPPEQSITVTDDWLLYWDAQQAEGDKIVRITPDATWKTGMAVREGALNLDADFEKTFTIYMGNSDSGADGMIFLMLPELPPADIPLNSGGNLGFSSVCNGKPCLGVEIDTYRNTSDPSADHIALIKNGSVNHNSTDNQALPSVPLAFNIEDDTTHSLTISWNKEAQVLFVALDGSTVFAHEGLDIKSLLGTSTATYGFVGATGSATSEQYFYPVMSIE